MELSDINNISPTKEWNISFNKEVNQDSLNGNIFIKDFSTGSECSVQVELLNDKKTVKINHEEDFDSGKMYGIYINKNIMSVDGESLISGIIMRFIVK